MDYFMPTGYERYIDDIMCNDILGRRSGSFECVSPPVWFFLKVVVDTFYACLFVWRFRKIYCI